MSSSDLAISVRGVGKQYVIAHEEKHTTLAEKCMARVRNPFRRPKTETFEALRDVSFDVKRGEVLGIIGRNGAGKSTLLKILSRITEPTAGEIKLYGRVASLLEVGTGFHPELTGRENIYLNGAILGMKRAEIKKKFDEIVAFAEVEKFLDTPVKRYSSGMYVRLAFAVAAHLEPEILIVDEVLAVGDAEFQKKCLGKMKEVSKGWGRTVLFVSHNMAAIRQLCTRCLCLSGGRVDFDGNTDIGVARHMAPKDGKSRRQSIVQNGVELVDVQLVHIASNVATLSPSFGEDYALVLRFRPDERMTGGAVVVRILDGAGALVTTLCSVEEGIEPFEVAARFAVTFQLPSMRLMPGQYSLSILFYRIAESSPRLVADDLVRFEVQPANLKGAIWPYRRDHGVARICGLARVENEDRLH